MYTSIMYMSIKNADRKYEQPNDFAIIQCIWLGYLYWRYMYLMHTCNWVARNSNYSAHIIVQGVPKQLYTVVHVHYKRSGSMFNSRTITTLLSKH